MKFMKLLLKLNEQNPKITHKDDELVSVCAWCNKILNRKTVNKSDAGITHGICQNCSDKVLKQMDDE